MSGDSLSLDSFGFRKEEIVLLISITYHGILSEAGKSKSFSRVRKYFRSNVDNNSEQWDYRDRKKKWAEQWKDKTCELLEVNDVIELKALSDELRIRSISGAKRNAMVVELSTFEPYFELDNGESWENLRYDDTDRSNYFNFCSSIIGNAVSFPKAHLAFNDCAKKITKSMAGPNMTWAWVGLGAAAFLIAAPYLAAAVGGAMGLAGAAATSAGLAFLGGGSLAAGGLGITGGYFALMAGGAILGYGAGSKDYKDKLKESSKEELLVSCSKLYAVTQISSASNSNKLEICKKALAIQTDCEAEADSLFFDHGQDNNDPSRRAINRYDARKPDAKALVIRAFRRIMRGDL